MNSCVPWTMIPGTYTLTNTCTYPTLPYLTFFPPYLLAYLSMEQRARVFVTFETEMAQTSCLKKYSFGILHRAVTQVPICSPVNLPTSLPARLYIYLPCQDTINDRIVEEAPEPSDVIWEHVGESKISRLQREGFSYLFSCVVVVISFIILRALSLSEVCCMSRHFKYFHFVAPHFAYFVLNALKM